MTRHQELNEDLITLPDSMRQIAKGLVYSKKDYEDLLVMANEALKISKRQERDPVIISELWGIYYNAFAGLIRTGTLCARQMGMDGFPEIQVSVNDKNYKVRESILVGIFREEAEYVIRPWKDESASYVEDRPFKMLTIEDEEEQPAEAPKSKKRGFFGRNKEKEKFTPIEMDDIASPVIDEEPEQDTEALISIEMVRDQKKKAPAPQGMDPAAEQKLRQEYEAKLKAALADKERLEDQLEKHKQAYKSLRTRSQKEQAEAQRYVYDPNYDHYYSEELPQIVKALEFSHSDMVIKLFCAAMSCIGIAVAFLFMI